MNTSSRTVAVRFLDQILARDIHLDALYRRTEFLALDGRDRRLTTELVYGVLRNRLLLDYFLARLIDRPLDRLESPVTWTLRVALYQIQFLRVPDRAVVHEAVKTCRKLGRTFATGLVNAVLRRFLRERPQPPVGQSVSALSVRFSHPQWLVRRYLDRYGGEVTERFLETNNQPPLPLLWVNPFKIQLNEFCSLLEREQISHQLYPELPNCVVVRSPSFSEHQLYREGFCFFMDPASQKIPYLVPVKNYRRLGDFCVAPGNKAFLLASKMGNNAHLYGSDSSYSRLRETAQRMRLMNVPDLSLLQADVSKHSPFKPELDFILLDVPCSGLGTLRSNPDIRWKVQEGDLPVFHDRQCLLLQQAFAALRAGGMMVYSTCSTEPEENETVVEEFLARESQAQLEGDYFRSFPEASAGDGFFAARVRHL